MNSYIIHYTKLEDRKNSVLSFLSKTNYKYEFITQYDKEEIHGQEYYKPNKRMYNKKAKPLWNRKINKFRILSPGEVSCAIKHILALEKIANQEEEYGLILEDDAIPIDNDFSDKISKLVNTAPDNWDSIWVGVGVGISFRNQKLKESLLVNERLAKVPHPSTNCSEAYLLKKESARRIYESIIPFQLAYDWELAYQFYKLDMNVYWSILPLFYNGSNDGQYDSELR